MEGQGRGIIMGVTGLLLQEPFYTIQTQKAQTFLGEVYTIHCIGQGISLKSKMKIMD